MKIHLIQMKIDELLAVCDEHNNDPGELINILHAAKAYSVICLAKCKRSSPAGCIFRFPKYMEL